MCAVFTFLVSSAWTFLGLRRKHRGMSAFPCPESRSLGINDLGHWKERETMNEELHDGRKKPEGGFQFTEEHMELLRRGDSSASDEIAIMMAKEIVRNFDSWMRAIRSKAGWGVCYEDCQDIVCEFRVKKLPVIIAKARKDHISAKYFTALFYTSLKNFAVDWIVDNPPPPPPPKKPLTDDEQLPSIREDFRNRLTAEEQAALVKDVRNFILRWTEDPLQRWVLEKGISGEMTAVEIAAGVEKAFPGKVYAVGSVYSLLSRFRSSPGLRRIKNQYFE